jgi:hypothetical protein
LEETSARKISPNLKDYTSVVTAVRAALCAKAPILKWFQRLNSDAGKRLPLDKSCMARDNFKWLIGVCRIYNGHDFHANGPTFDDQAEGAPKMCAVIRLGIAIALASLQFSLHILLQGAPELLDRRLHLDFSIYKNNVTREGHLAHFSEILAIVTSVPTFEPEIHVLTNSAETRDMVRKSFLEFAFPMCGRLRALTRSWSTRRVRFHCQPETRLSMCGSSHKQNRAKNSCQLQSSGCVHFAFYTFRGLQKSTCIFILRSARRQHGKRICV